MKVWRSFVVVTLLLAVLSVCVIAQPKSLFLRLGGREALVLVVDEFAARCIADKRINKKFSKSDPARLKHMLVEQLCAATGGPCQYQGRDMKTAHLNMGVTEGEFTALVENLVGALDKFKVKQAEKDELLKLLSPMKPAIVEVKSQETGTPLPKEFKPAPSMKVNRPRP